MTLSLGVDTGGTYTDAVLIRDEKEVIASAKSLTTRADLAIGVGKAISVVLEDAQVSPDQIAMASLSTTLATNALVEGQGGRVALIYIGFKTSDLVKHGLKNALKDDPALVIAGGHTHSGSEAAPLDTAGLEQFLDTHKGISGFAIAAQFATRNPAHELEAARIVSERTGAPVTCSHHLSAKLNGPKRAVTAVLNARLIGMIDRLIGRAQDQLRVLGISAPMMVVRGDGALMSAEQARQRPIETILSGPAASIVGARWLTGADNALVSDVGGTTTDVALIRDGKPAIDPGGAQVGGFRTMVEAVAMRTHGLGGDSQVHVVTEGLQGGVFLGPRRVLPVSLIAAEAPEVVHAILDEQLRATTVGEHDTRFVRRVPGVHADGVGAREEMLLERLGDQVLPLGALLRSRMENGAMNRLVDRGIIQVSGVTPSDASHVLGRVDAWDSEAARKALELVARKRVGSGDMLANSPEALAQMIVDQLTEQTSLTLLEAAFDEEQDDFGLSPQELARHVLTQRGLAQHRGLLSLNAALNVDVVGLGASAPSYYPAVGERLHCRMILPEHAGVANAIGAVVGRLTLRRSGTVTSPTEGRYRVHLEDGPQDFSASDEALALLERVLKFEAESAVREAGAEDIRVIVDRDIKTARVEAKDVFVEAMITVEASGRPRVATG
ncbi:MULTISPECIES: hydantoinase/oxoprolinase family protein [unclassified Ruegeria]|uniref:hydantoinase/oxoprolinase family protein n=1 Tax=unclassified Ruegeria TaxID=2625375 RepID=UPI0014892397|nr:MULTISPECIES: hydantoinase/oxoprolinase family protein [unclassified Ruegeria]NOD76009.1 hydantoinase/oxoprolinase family protein [Ruegeria sp. HKCCD4332]NOD89968.1 hydantoinase/oxoprolinase family protein [Ruegeria sp. HKCCD4318]NOE15041.1 hydantoinase/oxoprolinase family protein [Ruegeria sp. HKCCD4318-2]NOG10748.1 hydantoinase/oxoprolinase family protein [Ruegeria sp. HKCCD4315]